jgi:hypothetical protein
MSRFVIQPMSHKVSGTPFFFEKNRNGYIQKVDGYNCRDIWQSDHRVQVSDFTSLKYHKMN